MKVTLHHAGGETQELVFRNGQEIADYNGAHDVPGSKGLAQFTRGRGQVRWFSKPVHVVMPIWCGCRPVISAAREGPHSAQL